jgi:hypothetical protein
VLRQFLIEPRALNWRANCVLEDDAERLDIATLSAFDCSGDYSCHRVGIQLARELL